MKVKSFSCGKEEGRMMEIGIEEKLIERAKQGDKDAFTKLYASVYKDLYRFALCILRNKEEAEDAVSESVILAYENIHKLRKNNAFRSWIFRIVFNHCNKIMKNRVISSEGKEEEWVEFDMTGNLLLWEVFRELKDTERKILSLSIFGGYNSKEIAKEMHMTPGNVRSIKSRTLEYLRVQLS